MHSKWMIGLVGLGISVAVVAGCNQRSDGSAAGGPTVEGEKFLLAMEPAGAKDVIAAIADARQDDPVVVVGRIGGSHDPWIEGMAAFSIVDSSLQSCDQIEGDSCPTPWDYCCRIPELKSASALVKMVGATGDVVKTDARQLLALKELQTVVVRGKVRRDEAGNLTILATGIHVRK